MKIKDENIPNGEISSPNGNSATQNGDIINSNIALKYCNGNLPISNGSISHDEEPELQNVFESSNGSSINENRESGSPIDLIPFNIEGIQTVVKNDCDNTKTSIQNGDYSQNLLVAELRSCKEENRQLRAALKEASRVNQQWRNYHDEKQSYVQKLLSSLHHLQQETSLKQSNGKSSAEIQKLRDFISRQQKEHEDHIQFLQLQVKAHRDDWEAERSEKKVAEIGRIQAESQLRTTHRDLEEAKCMIKDMDSRIKLCKCFAGSDVVSHSNYDLTNLTLRHQNGNLAPLETTSCRISPSFSSNNSLCSSSASRSSSVSKEFSDNSSPTMSTNLQMSPTCVINYECNGTLSPSISIASKSSTMSLESQGRHEKSESSIRAISYSSQVNQSEELNSEGKIKSHLSSNVESNKGKTGRNDKGDAFDENSLVCYESKGARPKHSPIKRTDEDERKAKRRARSILASALPMSPSSSQPSSPVNVSSNKIGITSTLHDSIRSKTCSISKTTENSSKNLNVKKWNKSNLISDSELSKTTETLKTSVCDLGSYVGKTETQLKCINQRHDNLLIVESGKCHLETDNLVPDKSKSTTFSDKKFGSADKQGSCSQCSVAQEYEPKAVNNTSSKPADLHSTNNGTDSSSESKQSLEIKTASKMKQNTKSLIVTNNHDKCNTNYASITVMPGPSSALFSRTQTASTTSSPSSSPGISLTTFALNANGQGVPGAIFFALGTDTNPIKTSHIQSSNELQISSQQNIEQQQHQQNQSISETSEEISKNSIAVTNDSCEVNNNNERIVNSTWVQLSERDNSAARLTPKSPWRTARAVPSHKLNSVRKSHANENGKNSSPTFCEDLNKRNDNYFHLYNYGNNSVCHCNGNGYSKYHQTLDTKYQISLSPIPCFTSCPRGSPSLSFTSGQNYSQNDSINRNSPNICMLPHAVCSQSCTDSDLRSKASKNISSAILSYECGNIGCSTIHSGSPVHSGSTVHSGKYLAESPKPIVNYEEKRDLKPKVEKSSDFCLVCPSCQKLFSHDKNAMYERHIQACRGPKYIDM